MSVWQIPHARRRTSTSPAPGSASSSSCTTSGAPNSSSTAARILTALIVVPRDGGRAQLSSRQRARAAGNQQRAGEAERDAEPKARAVAAGADQRAAERRPERDPGEQAHGVPGEGLRQRSRDAEAVEQEVEAGVGRRDRHAADEREHRHHRDRGGEQQRQQRDPVAAHRDQHAPGRGHVGSAPREDRAAEGRAERDRREHEAGERARAVPLAEGRHRHLGGAEGAAQQPAHRDQATHGRRAQRAAEARRADVARVRTQRERDPAQRPAPGCGDQRRARADERDEQREHAAVR